MERLSRAERAAKQRSDRRRKLLDAAMEEARFVNYTRIEGQSVALVAGMSRGGINHEFGGMDGLKDAVMAEAVRVQDLVIIGQGLAMSDPIAKTVSPEIRAAAAAALA